MSGSTDIISSDEALAAIMLAVSGDQSLALDGDREWEQGDCAEVAFKVGPYRLVFFNDCGDLDYLDSVSHEDGRHGDTDDWKIDGDEFTRPDWNNPVDRLTDIQGRMLINLLKSAKPR